MVVCGVSFFANNKINLVKDNSDKVYRNLNVKTQSIPFDTITFTGKANLVDKINIGSWIAKNLDGLPCPYCGEKMISLKTINKKIKKNINADTTISKILEIIKPYEEYITNPHNKVLYYIREAAEKYPKYNLNKIFQKLRKERLPMLQKKQLSVFKEIRNTSYKCSLNEEDSLKIKTLTDEAKVLIEKDDLNFPFKRKIFIKKLQQITKQFSDKELAETINKISKKLPSSGNDADAFIVKYSGKIKTGIINNSFIPPQPSTIIEELFSKRLATAEHVIPQTNGGNSTISNLIVACKDCNNTRSSIPLEDWLKNIEDSPKYIQKYINAIIKRIKKGELPNHELYPIQISETLNKVSNGYINVNISHYKLDEKGELETNLLKELVKKYTPKKGKKGNL